MHCLTINDVVIIGEDGFINPKLQEAYNAYAARHGSDALSGRAWAIGRARAWLANILGIHVDELITAAQPILVKLDNLPIPPRFRGANGQPSERLRQILNYLNNDDALRKLWDRLSVFDDTASDAYRLLRDFSQASLGHLNILKGNIAEVLSLPRQAAVLERIRRLYPDAVIVSGIRVRTPGTGARRLFTDNIIASFAANGDLIVHHVFEVKAGFSGGVAGTDQILRWHQRLDEGIELIIPADAEILRLAPSTTETVALSRRSVASHIAEIQPSSSARVGEDFVFAHNMPDSASTRAIGLRGADRHVLTAFGEENRGFSAAEDIQAFATDTLSDFDQTIIHPLGESAMGLDFVTEAAPEIFRRPLFVNHNEMDYLVHTLFMNRLSGG